MDCLQQGFAVVNGKFDSLSEIIKVYVVEKIELCQPENLHICDGSTAEAEKLSALLVENGTAHTLTKLNNW